jgi:hypothetical protein
MRNIIILLIVLFFHISGFSVLAEENESSITRREASQGMEIIQIGQGQQLLVPKGAKIRRIGAQIVVEDTMESIVNRVTELEGRIQSLEAKNADMEQQIANLNEHAAKDNVFYDSSAGAGRS